MEEYSALGVAISTALRKFAPLHGVRVAHSFAEADAIAETMRPELFVLDLDPPPTGEIEFFNKLKRQYPEARALVIAAGTSRELHVERGTSGAIQFIEKPFDLAEFGAAVQALLGPWSLPETATLRGTLRDLHVIDLVELKCLAGATAFIQVEAPDEKWGEIYFQKGQICHAVTGTVVGRPALEEMLNWSGARLIEMESPLEAPRSIDADWQLVLLEIIRKLERRRQRHTASISPPPKPPAPRTGKKLLVIDDTEMLLIFVADVLATADQNFQILTAPTGAEGLRLAGSEKPDLVLLDYSLTDVTGDKVCRGLLENPATARIPVLMMSGHLTELAKTAEEYENVALALPKPFLSGALINAVEKLLAAGPLPATARRQPPSKPAAPSPAAPPVPPVPAAPRAESPVPLSPNGHSSKTAAVPLPAPDPAPPVAVPPPPAPSAPPVAEPAPPVVAPSPPPPAPPPPAMSPPLERPPAPTPTVQSMTISSPPGLVASRSELSVTLALKIISMQFTSSFEVETATMQPFDRIVSVKMGEKTELNGVPLETGFRLGQMKLGPDRQIETLRLVPTRQPPHLPVPSSSFPVGTSRFGEVPADPKLQLATAEEGAMRVRLTAQFELLTVELSAGFEVAAVLLQACPQPVQVRNDGGSAGRPFTVVEAQIDSAEELKSLLVRAVS